MPKSKAVQSSELCPDFKKPAGSSVQRNGKYLRIINAHRHPLASRLGRIPYHRFILYESLGRPEAGACEYCGYILPWKSQLESAYQHVVNADHVDGDTSNSMPSNLVASCWWCNANRSWAEDYPQFWANWRRWLKDVPPAVRPNLIRIAEDTGLPV